MTATTTQRWWKGPRPWRKRAAKCRKKTQTNSLPSFEPEPLRYVFFYSTPFLFALLMTIYIYVCPPPCRFFHFSILLSLFMVCIITTTVSWLIIYSSRSSTLLRQIEPCFTRWLESRFQMELLTCTCLHFKNFNYYLLCILPYILSQYNNLLICTLWWLILQIVRKIVNYQP